MRISVIATYRSGISFHRLINPMKYMPWEPGDSCNLLWEGTDMTIDCDILIYNKYTQYPIEQLRELQQKGMKIIVDMDDWWYLPTHHVNYEPWQQQRHSQKIEEHITMADLVICTSMVLQDKVRELNKNTVVIPNGFPYGQENYKSQPVPRTKMTFMYMGGVTHLPDVELLKGKFQRIGSDSYIKSNAEFVLAGYDKGFQRRYMTIEDQKAGNNNFVIEPSTQWTDYDKMETVFSYTNSYRVLPTTGLDNYINYYDQADVALCPLVDDNNWNQYKSVLKITEAGCKEIPIICSNVMPYKELYPYKGVLWVEHPDDWLRHIKWCVKNPNEVKELGKQLGEQVREDFDLLKWNVVRKQVIESLM